MGAGKREEGRPGSQGQMLLRTETGALQPKPGVLEHHRVLRAGGPEPRVRAGPHGARRWAPPRGGGRGGSRCFCAIPESGQVQGSRWCNGWRRPPAPGLPTPLRRNDTRIESTQHAQAPRKSDEEKTGSENPGVLLNSNFKNMGEAGHSSPAPQRAESPEHLPGPSKLRPWPHPPA